MKRLEHPAPLGFVMIMSKVLHGQSAARYAGKRFGFGIRCCATASSSKPKTVLRGNLNWAPLHTHTDYSFLDGASHVPDLASRAAEMGIPALAITDHGAMHGAIQHMKSCKQHGVKPIIGNEMYILNGDYEADGYKGLVHHLTVIAKNSTGYRNLVKLTSTSHLQGMKSRNRSKRPAINKELLQQHSEGLIVLSGCLAGEIPKALVANRYSVAREVALWYRDTFGADFYLEMMDHGLSAQQVANAGIMQLSKELGIKTVVTNDSHFTMASDCYAHDVLLCIQTGKLVSDPNRMRYTGQEYFKSADEMMELFQHPSITRSDIAGSLENTLEVASKVEDYNILSAPRIPTYPLPDGFDESIEDYFRETARAGLKEQIGDQYELAHYEDRLEYELQLLIDKGFASYFLIVWDYIRYARENGISVGPGRGSACGSLVAYGLRITEIDPVKHDLLFERFLNPERTSLPDIDTDFSMDGRERVIRYVTGKYGEDRVAQIITFNRLSSKSVLRDCARVTGIPYAEADKVSKLVPVARGKATKLEAMISDGSPSPEFKNLYETEPKMRDLVDVSMILEGTNRNSGVHAAGVVIGAEPLNTIVPLARGKNNEVVTQYAMEELEDVGLLKMDFLGLRNLSIIDSTREYVAKKNGEQLPILQDLSFSDKRTYDLLSTGKVDGVFQLDASGGMQEIVKKLGPNSISDISSILALYRPGPLDAGLVDTFIDRKHGREPVQFEHPLLESILHETYGVLVYQEQIMQVARDLAGYSLGQADILRRAMGKKKTDVMEHERGRFVTGAIKNNIDRKLAEKLFESMLKFAEYCFNKSHSTAYAYLTFQTAWLKTHYPVEFMASVLRLNSDNMTKLPRYIDDAASQGVVVLAPSVNTSDVMFAPVYTLPSGCRAPSSRNGYVGFGLGAIKGIGEVAAQAITDERLRGGDFKSIFDFCARLPSKVAGKRVLENLVQCGAFDDLHENRKAVFASIPEILDWRKKFDAKRKRAAAKLKDGGFSEVAHELDSDEIVNKIRGSWLEAESDYSVMERYFIEKQLVGFLTSGDLHKEYESWVRFALPNTLDAARGDPQPQVEESEVLDERPHEAGISQSEF